MRHLLVVILLALLNLGTTYYVRTDGHDTNCNGQTDQAEGVSNPDCAYLTIAKAMTVFNCTTPDTVTIKAGTFAGGWSTPDPCIAPSDVSRAIIEGQGATTQISQVASVDMTVSVVNDSTNWGTNQENKFLTIRDMAIDCSDTNCFYVTGTWEGLWFDNITFTMDDGGAATSTSGNAAAIGVQQINGAYGWRITDNTITGTGTATIGGLTGTDAIFARVYVGSGCGTCSLEPGLWFSGNTVNDMLGAMLDGGLDFSIVEDNTQDNTLCYGNEGSCVQAYNSDTLVIRRNIWTNAKPHASYAVIKLRSSDEDPNNSWNTSVIAYNNTIIGSTSTASSTGQKNALNANDVFFNASAKSYFANNLIVRNFGSDTSPLDSVNAGDRYAIELDDCGSSGFDISNNLFYNIGWSNTGDSTPFESLTWNIGAGCPATDPATLSNITGTDPSLDANWAPDNAADPPCGAGTTGISAPAQANQVADSSDSWIGAQQGACAGAPASTPQVLTITVTDARDSLLSPTIACIRVPYDRRIAMSDPPVGITFWWPEVSP